MRREINPRERVFKKSLAKHSRGTREKRELITTHKSLVGNGRRGYELIIARSTLYYRSKGKSLEQLKEEMDLRDQIERICLDFPRYGYRRVTKQLQRGGWIVNHKRVLRVMRENDLLCRIRRRHVRSTDINHSYPVFPNLIKDLVVTSINQVWDCDTT